MPKKAGDPNARFDAKVVRSDNCWEWTGSRNDFGYGLFYLKGDQVRAHRYSYERAFGAVPDGLYVLHKCDNPKCVRPDHLFLGTLVDNSRDMVSKGRMRAADA